MSEKLDLSEEFVRTKINPIVGYLVNSGRGAEKCGLPDSADWEYLREGTARIKALIESLAKAAPPQPTVIEGRGQAVTESGWYGVDEGSGEPDIRYILAGTHCFANGWRFIKIETPTFPPRPAFVAPEKPELVLVRNRMSSKEKPQWVNRNGDWLVTSSGTLLNPGAYQVIDPTTGEPSEVSNG